MVGPNIEKLIKLDLPSNLSQQSDKLKIHLNTGSRGEKYPGNIQFDYEAVYQNPNSEQSQEVEDFVSIDPSEFRDSPGNDDCGRYYIRALEDDGTHLAQLRDDYYKEIDQKVEAALKAEAQSPTPKKDRSGKLINDHPAYPELSHSVQLNTTLQQLSWDDFLEAYAEASHLPVVSDSFPMCYDNTIEPLKGSCQEVLQKASDRLGWNWSFKDGVIEVQNVEFTYYREAQVPDALILDWRERFKKDRTLLLDDMAQIVQLTDEQIRIGIGRDEVLGQQFMLKNNCTVCKIPLKIYGALDERQKKALMSKEGLDSRWLREDQWGTIGKYIEIEQPQFFKQNDPQELCFTCELSKTNSYGASKSYFIIIHKGDARGVELMYWTVSTPEYMDRKPQ
jgi:hypothetical protein